MAVERLRITEIFYSLQGEAATVGWPTVFIRLTGCPLRCGYCDTTYAFQGGEWWTLDDILHEVKKYQENDPIGIYRAHLIKEKIATAKELDAIDDQVDDEVQAAVQFAEDSPEPALEELFTDIYVD